MKVKLCQLSPRLGDIDFNLQKVLTILKHSDEADIIVFPELFLVGYPPTDTLFYEDTEDQLVDAIESIKTESLICDALIIVGAPIKNDCRWYNSALCIYKGDIVYQYQKQLLPNYDIFSESRYFSRGKSNPYFEWKGKVIGIFICEDIWNNPQKYDEDPVDQLSLWLSLTTNSKSIDVIIHISASPFEYDKVTLRGEYLVKLVNCVKAPVVSVNQIGAYSDVIFDGASVAINAKAEICFQLPSFEESYSIVDLINNKKVSLAHVDSEQITLNAIYFGLREYLNRSGFKKCLVGISGGVDSSLVATLAVQALGKKNVILMSLPTKYNSSETKSDAELLAGSLGCEFYEYSIEKFRQSIKKSLKKLFSDDLLDITDQNIQSRLRGLILMAISNQRNALLLTTGNKSELAMGYATLYGDMCGGLNIIGDLFKTDVFKLAKYINMSNSLISSSIIERPPSAELAPNQKDSDSLPEYEVLDVILNQIIIEKISISECLKMNDNKDVMIVIDRLKKHEFKRFQSPPILKLSSQSFGRGWQYPLVS